jgi:hypothetical protein
MMIRCRSFKQLIVLLGAAILLPSVVAWAQAPRCAGVLSLTVVTQEQIDKTVSGLAELKLAVDLAQSRGQMTLQEKQLARAFVTKLTEFNNSVQAELSTKQVQSLLAEKIRDLQKTEDTKITEELQARYDGKQVLSTYDLKGRLQVRFDSGTHPDLKFIPHANLLVYKNEHRLTLLNPDGGAPVVIAEHIDKFAIKDDSLLMVSDKSRLARYNLAKGELINLKIQLKGDTPRFSPNGEWVAYQNSKTVEFLNIATGKLASHKFTELEPVSKFNIFKKQRRHQDDTLRQYRFINDSEILVFIGGSTILKFNFLTGLAEEISTGRHNYEDVVVVGENLILKGREVIASIQASQLSAISENAIYFNTKSMTIFDITAIDGNIFYLRYQFFGLNEAIKSNIVDAATLTAQKQQANFEYLFTDADLAEPFFRVFSPAIDTQGKRLFFPGCDFNGKGTHIDVWSTP